MLKGGKNKIVQYEETKGYRAFSPKLGRVIEAENKEEWDNIVLAEMHAKKHPLSNDNTQE